MQRHRTRGRRRAGRPLVAASGIFLLAVAGPAVVLAHAELVSSTPADGAVLTEPPTEIVLTYSQGLDEGSSIVLKDAHGTTIATGTPASIGITEMRATFASLTPGTYTIESTTKSSEDGEIDRATVTFTVAEPTPPPTDEPSAGTAPSQTTPPTITPTPPSTPSPAASAAGGNGGSGPDVLLPLAVVGLLIGGGLAFFLRRRGAA
ncbi:MAG: copper resistance protein CopC [Chloroflexi bacterium]|nr:copper resistance protein CopC [Chloroflexota bacterium]